MPVVSRAMRGPKSEEILRQETLAKIDARKARIAAATAKLVERRTSKPRSKQAQKFTVPAAIQEHNLAEATTAVNAETAVPAAGKQNKVLVREERAVAVPAALSNKGIFPSHYIECKHELIRYQKTSHPKSRGP